MMNNNQMQDRELGWDDTIQKDSEYILLPEGDYVFEVSKFERARYTPNANSKLPACNMAKLELKVLSEQGTAIINHNLYLHTSTEGMLSAFFSSIGMKKKNEPIQMKWNEVLGAKGACKVKHREYNGNKFNDIKSFYAKDASYYQNKEIPEIVKQLTQPNQGYQTPPQQNGFQQPQQGYQQQSNFQQPHQSQPGQQGGFVPGSF